MASSSSFQKTFEFQKSLAVLNEDMLPTNNEIIRHLNYYTQNSNPRKSVDNAKTLIANELEVISESWSNDSRKKKY